REDRRVEARLGGAHRNHARFALTLEAVERDQRQRVVDGVAQVGVVNDSDRRLALRLKLHRVSYVSAWRNSAAVSLLRSSPMPMRWHCCAAVSQSAASQAASSLWNFCRP